MKTKIFALFVGLLCLITSALAQSETLTGFNGRIDFSGFTNNGLNIRGTLKNFTDQTGLYIASDIDTGDVAWDNNGKRYAVVGVISSNATQAVVDLSRIGGGTHIPKGAGLVSRETFNGLTLIASQNSSGISAKLMGMILTHNFKLINEQFLSYVGTYDSLYGVETRSGFIKDSTSWGLHKKWGTNNYSQLYFYRSPSSKIYTELYDYNQSVGGGYFGIFSGVSGNVNVEIANQNTLSRSGYTAVAVDTTGPIFRGFRTNYYGPWSYGFPKTDVYSVNLRMGLEWRANAAQWGQGSWVGSNRKTISGTTDGSGDIAITFDASMPDATYTVIVTGQGATPYVYMTQPATLATGSVKVRMFTLAGSPAASTAYQISYEVKDL